MKIVKVPTTCPCCNHEFEIDVNPAALLASGLSEAKYAAILANTKKPRPGARGKKKPRKPKVQVEASTE